MHEYSIAQGIVRVVLSAIDGRQENVKKIWVKAGIAKAVMPEALHFSFDVLKREHTQLEDAELCIEIIPLSGLCRKCGKEFELDRVLGICPHCGGFDVQWTSGTELFVEKIEI